MEFTKHEFTDLAYKDTYCQPYHWSLTKEKEKDRKKFKPLLKAFTKTFSWISFSYIIYKTSTDHAQIDIVLTWYLKLIIFQIKLALDQQNWEKVTKKAHYLLLFWHNSVFVSVLHRTMLIGYTYSSQFMEWKNLGTVKHATCSPNAFKT